jgi:hypothetical protein
MTTKPATAAAQAINQFHSVSDAVIRFAIDPCDEKWNRESAFVDRQRRHARR